MVSSGIVWLAAVFAAGPDPRLKAVEDHYNNARSLTAEFDQKLLVKGRLPRVESGRIVLLKPRRMRLDYAQPQGKFFLSDGKTAYYFTPSTNRVEKTALKESDDFRSPLALMLGRLHFQRDFEEIQVTDVADGVEVRALPKNRNFDFDEALFTIGKDSVIRRIQLKNPDSSIMEFTLREEKLNAPVGDALFQFVKPAGAEVVVVKAFEKD